MPQATCFHIFLMISPWISLSAFQALARKCSFWSFQKYSSTFPQSSMAQKYRFWAIWNNFSIFPELRGSKYSFCGFHAKFIWKFVSNGRWRGSFAAFPGPWLKNNGVLFFNLTIIVYCSYLINSFVSNPRWAKCRKPTVFWPLGFTVFFFFVFCFLTTFFCNVSKVTA